MIMRFHEQFNAKFMRTGGDGVLLVVLSLQLAELQSLNEEAWYDSVQCRVHGRRACFKSNKFTVDGRS